MSTRVFIFLLILFLLLTGCNPDRSPAPSLAAPQPTLTPPATFTARVPTHTLSAAPPTVPVPTATGAPTVVPPTALPQLPLGRGSCFVYDGERGEVLAFGGLLSGTFEASKQTWAWDGRSWKQYHPKTRPPARVGAAMVYDSARKQVILFGGAQMNGPAFGDMWVWDGENWLEQKPHDLPVPRSQPLMVYDDARNEIFLFGGYFFDQNFTLNYLNETWIFDGQTWTKRTPSHSPLLGDGTPFPNMTYDAARKQVVLWQPGYGAWIWNGTDWRLRKGAGEPPLRLEGAIGYDAKTQLVHLWGYDEDKVHEFPPENWQYNGQTWAVAQEGKHSGSYAPEASILFDTRRQKLLMFAYVAAKDIPVQIWEWSSTGWQKVNQP